MLQKLGTREILTGVCVPQIASNDICEKVDLDGLTRQYQCITGYKCGDIGTGMRCHLMYGLADGEKSNEPMLCKGGFVSKGLCASVTSIENKAGVEVVSPYKCDLNEDGCYGKLSDGT